MIKLFTTDIAHYKSLIKPINKDQKELFLTFLNHITDYFLVFNDKLSYYKPGLAFYNNEFYVFASAIHPIIYLAIIKEKSFLITRKVPNKLELMTQFFVYDKKINSLNPIYIKENKLEDFYTHMQAHVKYAKLDFALSNSSDKIIKKTKI